MVGLRCITGVRMVGIQKLYFEICSFYRRTVYSIKRDSYVFVPEYYCLSVFQCGHP